MATITAMPGNDSLVGTTNHDTFVFQDGWGQDTIKTPYFGNGSGGYGGSAIPQDTLDFSQVTKGLTIDYNQISSQTVLQPVNDAGGEEYSTNITHTINITDGTDTALNSVMYGVYGESPGTDYQYVPLINNIIGGQGNDDYVIYPYFRNLLISDPNGRNTLDLSNTSYDYTINMSPSQTLDRQFQQQVNVVTSSTINSITWTPHSIQEIIGGSGNSTVTLDDTVSDTFCCKTGNDTVTGGNAGDTFYAGSGNNVLNGGAGTNIYNFYNGFGQDAITTTLGGWNQIQFHDLNSSNTILSSDASGDLLIGQTDNPNSEIVVKQGSWINRIQTADGLHMSGTDINTLMQDISAYTASHGETINSLQDVKNDPNLLQMVHSAFHS